MDFLNRLITSRKKIGTQNEVAEKSEVSRSTISRIESGNTTTFEFTFLKFLASKGVDLNWLFTGKTYKPISDKSTQTLIEALEMKIDALTMKAKALEQLYDTTYKENKELRKIIKEKKE